MELNRYIDHTLIKRDSTKEILDKYVEDAIKWNFITLCIHPMWIDYVKERLHANNIGITAVVGFPYGTQTTEAKVFEGQDAIRRGADELDYVINVSMIKSGDWEYVENELKAIRAATEGTTIKIILEIALLSDDQIAKASRIASNAKWDFVKTSTGIDCSGATLEAVKIMKDNINPDTKIKAAGGVRTYEDAEAYINAGASRIGTSNGVDILEGKEATHTY